MAINKNFRSDLESIGWLTNGSLYFAILDANDNVISGYESMGLVDAIDVSFEATKIDLYGSLKASRSKFHTVTTEKNGTVSLTFRNFNASNIAKYSYGDITEVAASIGEVETIVAYLGKTIPLSGVVSGNVVVESGIDTLEEGKNYEVNEGSLYLYSTEEQTELGATTIITEKSELTVTYDTKEVKEIQAFVKDSLKIALYFEGRNIADNNENENKVWMHVVELNPTTLPILSTEDFGSATVEGSILTSRAVQGAGVSQFMKIVTVK